MSNILFFNEKYRYAITEVIFNIPETRRLISVIKIETNKQ